MFKKIQAVILSIFVVFSVIPAFATTNKVVITDVAQGKTDTGKYYVDVTLENPVAGSVLGAAFYQDDVLVGLNTVDVTAASLFPFPIEVDAKDADRAKVFVWNNMQEAKPLGKAKDISITGDSDLKVMTPGAVITGGTYQNVIISPEIGDGDVTLDGVTIKENLTILGGGSHSIVLKSCEVAGAVVMNKAEEDGEPPSLKLTETILEKVEVLTPASIQANDAASVVDCVVATATVTVASDAVQKIEIPENAPENIAVTVTGESSVDIEVNSEKGVEIAGENVTVSTTLADTPSNILVGGTTVSHIHKWGEPTKTRPGCEEDGKNVYDCTDAACGQTKTEIIHKTGHNYGKWTYLDKEYHNRICAKDTTHVEKNVHIWDEGVVTKQPTVTAEGEKLFTCTICDGTKTETLPVKKDIKITLVQDGNNIKAIWDNNDYPNYCLEVVDTNGKGVSYCWSNTGNPESYLTFGLPLIESGTQTYSLVLYPADEGYNADWDYELARLDNCIEVTVSGEAFPYHMMFNCPAAGEHTMVLGATIPGNAVRSTGWYRNGESLGTGGGSSSQPQYAGTTESVNKTNIQSGDVIDFRIIETLLTENQVLKATMTPSSKTTYQENDVKEISFLESDGLMLCWRGATLRNGEKYIATIKEPVSYFHRTVPCMSLGEFFDEDQMVSGKLTAKIEKQVSETETLPFCAEKEIANVTLTGQTPDFTIQRDDAGNYRFVSDMTGGAWVYTTYDKNGNLKFVGNEVNGAISSSAKFGDGHKVVARYMTWTLNADKTYAEISLSNLKEYTYEETEILITKENSNIKATWPDYGETSHVVKIINSKGEVVLSKDFNSTKEILVFGNMLPLQETVGTESYSFVVYSMDGRELGRLDNAIQITVEGEPLPYEIAFHSPSSGTHTVTIDTTNCPSDAGMRSEWKNSNGSGSRYSSSISTTETLNVSNLEEFVCDFRMVSPLTLDGKTVKATMTPPSRKTYKEDEAATVEFTEKNGILGVDLSGFDYPGYLVRLQDENGNKVSNDKVINSDFIRAYNIVPMTDSGTETYTIVIFAKNESGEVVKEIARLEDALEVTVTDPFPYHMTFDDGVKNQHSWHYTGTGTPSGVLQLFRWYDRAGTLLFTTTSAVSSSGTEWMDIDDNHTMCDLRVISSLNLDGKMAKAVITGPSVKVKPVKDENIRLVMDGNYLKLVFEDENQTADDWYYLYQDGIMIPSDNILEQEITWLLPGITESKKISYEVKKGNWESQETLAKLDEALNITVSTSRPTNLRLTPQDDGTYKITSNQNTGYFYNVKAPDGSRVATDYTVDGTFSCAIYEGCTVEIQAGTITVAEDGKSADITMSPVVTFNNPALHTSTNANVEVDTIEELVDALNRGSNAILVDDITATGTVKLKAGAPAKITLNGHKLTAPNLRVYYGKELTIDGTKEGSEIVGQVSSLLYAKVTLNGGTYPMIQVNDTRELNVDGITATGSQYAMLINRSNNIHIKNSEFTGTDTTNNGVLSGLYVSQSGNVTLENVKATSNYFGADICNSTSEVTILNSEFYGDREGIRLLNTAAVMEESKATSPNGCAISLQNGGNVTISGGTYEGKDAVIHMSGSACNAEIQSGRFLTTTDLTNIYIGIFTLNQDNVHSATISGGTFENVDYLTVPTRDFANQSIVGGTYSFDPQDELASDCFANDNMDGTYTVQQVAAPL